VTVDPDVPDGTGNMQVNPPVEFETRLPDVQEVIVTWSNTSEVSAVETENPVPATVTDSPRGPWVGVTVIAGVVTVNVPLADCPPLSVTWTVVPVVPAGTASVQLNSPVDPVVRPPAVQSELGTATESKIRVTVELTENPYPETCTVECTGP
jgi:hypothetical protein